MATKREQILQAIKAKLAAQVTGVTGVYRSRADKFAGTEAPALNLMPDQEQPEENALAFIDARTDIEVQVFHRGNEPDSLADPFVQAVHTAMMSDPTLAGLAIDMTEGATSWDFDETDRTSLLVRMRFTVWYRHTRTSLA